MLSVVIPTLNAERTLPGCLAAVSEADEILVVDGESSDDTAAMAERAGARLVRSSRGRGAQLHAGALAAQGDWLLFLHADTLLAPGWRDAADLHMASMRGSAAYFRFRLDSQDWRARIVEKAVALRSAILKLPYGDQGVLISRNLYDDIGGFRPLPLMEDVELVRRVGRSRMTSLPVDAVTSAERWHRDGWLRRSARNFLYLLLYRAGVAPHRLAELYD
ncbi:MAG: glycosyltransferase [Sphingomonas sp.]|nr:glycosyltransferase [Sphingomonas sp.]